MKNKNGAIEMSIGTIITIVLLMAILFLGIYFVKNIFTTTKYEANYNFCYNKTITPLYRLDLYVSEGCPHCANQKEILGPYLNEVGDIIDCASDGSRCIEENITGVPTWKIHNEDEQFVGVHTINELAEILGEYDYQWTCEYLITDTIFKEENKDVDILITDALEIESETNRSFQDECLSYGGEFIEGNFSDKWTCRLVESIPMINVSDLDREWLDENCECALCDTNNENCIAGEQYCTSPHPYLCYDKIMVREIKNV